MTINSITRKAGPFIGNGSTSAFPFSFKVFQASDLEVVRLDTTTNTETSLVLTSDYTVTLNLDQDSNPGGTVTLLAGALAAGYTLTLTSDLPNLQPTDLTNQGGFYPDVINDALDRATIQIQQLQEQTNRSIKVPVSSDSNTTLPTPESNNLIGWDATAENLVNIDPTSLGTVVAYATAYADVFLGNGLTTQWTLTRNPGVLYNLDVSINGSTQEPTRDYTLASTAITFTTAPPLGSRVLVKYKEGLPNYSGDSQDIRFAPFGVGAVTRSVQTKLREWVSITDFIPTSIDPTVTDCTAYINAAFASAKFVWIPAGVFYCTDELYFLQDGGVIDGVGTIKFATSKALNVINTTKVQIRNIKLQCVAGYCGIHIRTGNEFNAIRSNTLGTYEDFVVDNVIVDNYSSGYKAAEFGYHCVCVRSDTASRIRRVTITNNTLQGAGFDPNWASTMNGSDNIYVSAYDNSSAQLEDVVISGNHCRYAGRQNISLAASYLFPVKNVTITGNTLIDSTLSGIDLEQGQDVTITGNYFEGNGNLTYYWNPNSASAPTSSMRSGITAHDNAYGRYTCTSNVFKNCYYGISGYYINATDSIFIDSLLGQGTFAGCVVELTACKLYLTDASKKMIDAYTSAPLSNRYTDCLFNDLATGTRSANVIYINSASNAQNQFTNCHFYSATTGSTYAFIGTGYCDTTFVSSTIKTDSLIFLKLYDCAAKFNSCAIQASVLVKSDYVGESYVHVIDCEIDVDKLDDYAGSGNALSEYVFRDNRIKVTAKSSVSVTRKLYVVNNRFDVSSVADSNSILYFYPQPDDGFAATIVEVMSNEVIGTNSTKRFVEESSSASSNVCLVNYRDNRFASSDILTLASQYYVRAVATGTTAITANNYYYVSGTGFGLLS